ncbi:MAG: hypothetical protein J5J06_07310 [Phycisphaerae bacterium]|nr:hypothetical protein [Phycisphaerae bacterium]
MCSNRATARATALFVGLAALGGATALAQCVTTRSPCDGDITGDSVVDFADYAAITACWGTQCGDLDGDATTDFDDLAIYSANLGCDNRNIVVVDDFLWVDDDPNAPYYSHSLNDVGRVFINDSQELVYVVVVTQGPASNKHHYALLKKNVNASSAPASYIAVQGGNLHGGDAIETSFCHRDCDPPPDTDCFNQDGVPFDIRSEGIDESGTLAYWAKLLIYDSQLGRWTSSGHDGVYEYNGSTTTKVVSEADYWDLGDPNSFRIAGVWDDPYNEGGDWTHIDADGRVFFGVYDSAGTCDNNNNPAWHISTADERPNDLLTVDAMKTISTPCGGAFQYVDSLAFNGSYNDYTVASIGIIDESVSPSESWEALIGVDLASSAIACLAETPYSTSYPRYEGIWFPEIGTLDTINATTDAVFLSEYKTSGSFFTHVLRHLVLGTGNPPSDIAVAGTSKDCNNQTLLWPFITSPVIGMQSPGNPVVVFGNADYDGYSIRLYFYDANGDIRPILKVGDYVNGLRVTWIDYWDVNNVGDVAIVVQVDRADFDRLVIVKRLPLN